MTPELTVCCDGVKVGSRCWDGLLLFACVFGFYCFRDKLEKLVFTGGYLHTVQFTDHVFVRSVCSKSGDRCSAVNLHAG